MGSAAEAGGIEKVATAASSRTGPATCAETYQQAVTRLDPSEYEFTHAREREPLEV